MATIDEKKAEVARFLAERESKKRQKLEEIIVGKTGLRAYIVPIVFTVAAMGVLVMLGAAGVLDPSVVSLLIMVFVAINTWQQSESNRTEKRIRALKEYIDSRLGYFDSDLTRTVTSTEKVPFSEELISNSFVP